MDLLRLVFCYQTIDSILRLPKLTESVRFQKQRAAVRGYEYDKDPIAATTRFGELSKGSEEFVLPGILPYRALFLRDVESIIQTIDGSDDSLDFWLCIESGIPEAQAKAISAYIASEKEGFTERSPITNSLSTLEFNDITAIPWTNRLINIIRSLLREDDQDTVLHGFLQAPLKNPKLMGWNYYIGLCTKVLNGGETIEENPILEKAYNIVSTPGSYAMKKKFKYHSNAKNNLSITAKLIVRSGYVRPLLKLHHSELSYLPFRFASYCLLKLLSSTTNISHETATNITDLPLTKHYRERVRRILSDQELTDRLNPMVILWYRMVAFGEVFHGCNEFEMARLGICEDSRAHVVLQSALDNMKYKSLQGISFYEVKNFAAVASDGCGLRYPVEADLYRKGISTPATQISLGGYDREYTILFNDSYDRILSYLNGRSKTWMS